MKTRKLIAVAVMGAALALSAASAFATPSHDAAGRRLGAPIVQPDGRRLG